MKIKESEQKFSILVVDDEPKNIQLVGSLLKSHDYEVEFAMDGQKAVNWVYTKSFDLILLDIMMPGMDGYDVCLKIKSDITQKHIPVIFLSAKAETDDIVKGFDVGGSDYITKPFNPPELLSRVKKEVELKMLRGLIPICANCKNIRDDEGIWKRIETYIQDHSAALFSHGMCPKCMDKLYGEQEWYKKSRFTKTK